MNGYGKGFFGLPPVVKNLIIVNVIMLIAYYAVNALFDIDLIRVLGLYFPKSELFKPFQIVTHLFMHGGFWHLFLNMFALYMFGQVLESVWGPKRFLIYYFVCGLGAAFTHETVIYFQYHKLITMLSPEQLSEVFEKGYQYVLEGSPAMSSLQSILLTPTVGASGAVFGILLAFGVLFPNTQLMIIFPPIPIKAKYFVLIYGAIELYLAFSQPGSKIAHAAHLGGMLFGYLLIRYWQKTTKTLY
ncbi:MAG: rhomboid family intramembrane serine protease [Bacteroidales bacterium]|nr:rhomboid family intramembrane serine protease [Bacteroidales bacterium]